MLDTWEFRAILKNEKALNPLRLKASEMAKIADIDTMHTLTV